MTEHASTYKRMEDSTPQDCTNIVEGMKAYTDPKYLTDSYYTYTQEIPILYHIHIWHYAVIGI